MSDDQMPVFPDITPSSIKRRQIHTIRDEEMQTDEDISRLIRVMYEFPEREFYLFSRKDARKNSKALDVTRTGDVIIVETQFHYYEHPKYKGDFVRIQKAIAQFDWEHDVLASAPMFMRSTLALSERCRRKLDRMAMIRDVGDILDPVPKTFFERLKRRYKAHEFLWQVLVGTLTLVGVVLGEIALL